MNHDEPTLPKFGMIVAETALYSSRLTGVSDPHAHSTYGAGCGRAPVQPANQLCIGYEWNAINSRPMNQRVISNDR